jgi:hypothetical protein
MRSEEKATGANGPKRGTREEPTGAAETRATRARGQRELLLDKCDSWLSTSHVLSRLPAPLGEVMEASPTGTLATLPEALW